MQTFTKHFKKLALGAVLYAAGAVGLVAADDVLAQTASTTISNTANVEWLTETGQRVREPSNQVDIIVREAPPAPPTINTYRFGTGSGSFSANVGPTRCAGTQGVQTVRPTGVFSTHSMQPATLVQESRFRAGEPVIFGVKSAADNRDPNVIDTLNVIVTTASGDREEITLVESSANSGQFFGLLNTVRIPPAVVQGDCRLSVSPGEDMPFTVTGIGNSNLVANAIANFLVDPFGIVFDSGDGAPVPGSRVTLINADTNQPADVFGDDGTSSYPNSVITGETVTDSSGAVYTFPPGDYRFPFVAPGRYFLRVEPPAPFTAPSTASPGDLAGFVRPDNGQPYTIDPAGSYGGTFVLNSPAPVRIDIPVDRPGTPIILTKSASSVAAVAGDAVQYRVEIRNPDQRRTTGRVIVRDTLPIQMRLRPTTVRIDGTPIAAVVSTNGREFSVEIPALAPSERRILTYVVEIRPDSAPGDALNKVQARDSRGVLSNTADANVRIRRDTLGDRVTIIGRVTYGGCTVDPRTAKGISGVRVMLQDGSYTVTDEDGRYHFEGVRPGLSVVQIDPSTLPLDQQAIDCAQNSRSAGSAISRFIEARGGDLKRADFRAITVEPRLAATNGTVRAVLDTPKSDIEAAGAERDWASGQSPGIEWLFPEVDHNPRNKAIRVAIKHLPGQIVELFANGQKVEPLTFDGVRKSEDGNVAVSVWRGVEITEKTTLLKAVVKDTSGAVVQELTRSVHYGVSPMNAQLIRDKSTLVADGVQRPTIVVRLTDRDGKPVKHGLTGDFSVPAPYYPAVEADAQQANQLAGLERARPVWRVQGDDGLAVIELEPTTASGSVSIGFTFKDGETTRQQSLDLWLDPGQRPWTIVGFAAGTVGYNTLDDRLDPLDREYKDVNADARLALYAKGRIKGKWLMTMAYDSDKEEDQTRFAGTIDPRAYYTVYADKSDTRYDAASVRKLYLKLERPQFYALFGDYETGLGDTQLTRYQRSMNGIKTEYRSPQVAITAFGADTPYRYRRDEIQGNGLTGPYPLNARDILPNTEKITLEVRDRLRSEQIIDRQILVRYIDYDIDYIAGTIRFTSPVLSRDSGLNPQFIVAEYEVDGVGQRVVNAGGRVAITSKDEKLRVGATAIHNEDDGSKTNLGGLDVRYRPNVSTEFRAEIAVSDATAKTGGPASPAPAPIASTGQRTAWLIEAEHHGPKVDALAYVREREGGFGVGQLNASEEASRKYGIDARLRVTDAISIAASGWQEDFLDTDMRRRAARILAEYRSKKTDFRAGITHANDRLATGSTNVSSIVQLGVTQRLLDNKLELDAQTEFALGGKDDSVDFPSRHRFGARYAINSDISLVGAYEIAEGGSVKARTLRAGFDLKPWAGGRFTASANNQDIEEYGPRSYAAFGLAQSVRLNDRWSFDFTLDGNKTLSGISATDVLNPNQPVASGGFIGRAGSGTITEDFVAVTMGATYRGTDWSATTRTEYRDGELSNRWGISAAVLRKISEGRSFGGLFTWTKAKGDTQTSGQRATSTEAASLALSWANRPDDSRWAWFNKLELRSDAVRDAVFGAPGPIGGPGLLVSGTVDSRRAINSLSINFTPLETPNDVLSNGKKRDNFVERGEYGLFWGTRYTSDRFGLDDVKGWSNIFGADFKFDLNDYVSVGAAGTVRIGTGNRTRDWSGGPQLTVTPFKNANVTLGYNFTGYRDRDFEEARYTRDGVYLTFKIKFDQETFEKK